jgi:hypothetical protein
MPASPGFVPAAVGPTLEVGSPAEFEAFAACVASAVFAALVALAAFAASAAFVSSAAFAALALLAAFAAAAKAAAPAIAPNAAEPVELLLISRGFVDDDVIACVAPVVELPTAPAEVLPMMPESMPAFQRRVNKPAIARTPIVTPTPIPALAPVLRPLFLDVDGTIAVPLLFVSPAAPAVGFVDEVGVCATTIEGMDPIFVLVLGFKVVVPDDSHCHLPVVPFFIKTSSAPSHA